MNKNVKLYSQRIAKKNALQLIYKIGPMAKFSDHSLYDESATFFEVWIALSLLFLHILRSKIKNRHSLAKKIIDEVTFLFKNGDEKVKNGIVIGFLEDISNENFRKNIPLNTIRSYLSSELIGEFDSVLQFWGETALKKQNSD
ncbi:MAG: hypothetical protein Q8P95_04655 [bacterium]|nr:hypothetical protein [bacterium]